MVDGRVCDLPAVNVCFVAEEVEGDVGVVEVGAYGVVVADQVVAENKLGCVVAAKQLGEQHEQMVRERDIERKGEKAERHRNVGYCYGGLKLNNCGNGDSQRQPGE
jgi:hypothetical protein